MRFLVLHPADASGEALSPAPFCFLYGSPAPPARSVPHSCPLWCQAWQVPCHHRGLWLLRQHSWAQGPLKAEGWCCPKDFPYTQKSLHCSIRSTLWSPPTHHLLRNIVCINPCTTQLRHPYPRVLNPHMQLKQLGRSPSTCFRRAKTRVLESEGLQLAAGNLAVYILLENSFPWRNMACIWMREQVPLLWGELERNTRWKLFALSFQHVLV